MRALLPIFLTLFAGSLFIPAPSRAATGPAGLVAHEWGTFTSIAGRDGTGLDWRPLRVKSDLPTFVYSIEKKDGFRNTVKDGGKSMPSRIRMETPVIYFYAPSEMEVDVAVSFPDGIITEWYPQAGLVNGHFGPDSRALRGTGITWGNIKLVPGGKDEFLRETATSHYYPARETDATPVQVCNADKSRVETEKFLFYRGLGSFNLPLQAKIEGNRLKLSHAYRNFLTVAPTDLMVFENRGGKIGFRVIPAVTEETTVERPTLDADLESVLTQLQKTLVAKGLYEKEARAMIATWRDSWFEEGLRIFYILPRKTTDEILPLEINPKPVETVRVLVGRTEVITPEMTAEVKSRVEGLRSASAKERAESYETLRALGRFYEPIVKEMLVAETDPRVRRQLERLLESE